jgi:hypothetical protein
MHPRANNVHDDTNRYTGIQRVFRLRPLHRVNQLLSPAFERAIVIIDDNYPLKLRMYKPALGALRLRRSPDASRSQPRGWCWWLLNQPDRLLVAPIVE